MTDFTETIRNIIEGRLSTVYTALPGIVRKFDGARADIEPAVSVIGKRAMPVLGDVPVVFPSSGSSGFRFEISEGDTVLLVFSSSSLDEWLSGDGQKSTTDDPRRFNLTDAVAIPGLFSFASTPELQGDAGAVMSHGGTTVTIKKNGDVEIGGAGAQKLVTESFVSAFNRHTHPVSGAATGPVSTPIVADTVTTAKTSAL